MALLRQKVEEERWRREGKERELEELKQMRQHFVEKTKAVPVFELYVGQYQLGLQLGDFCGRLRHITRISYYLEVRDIVHQRYEVLENILFIFEDIYSHLISFMLFVWEGK